ncbi:hypothetical protein NDU88_004948 [Pleurodeles waltl]|uniref:Uncharacterized protein n=1 Tax=Pleurodeles waltl TaxID=8319 RepID=A0AAV7QDF3_PLEWA|nr:hypothetical protein NDU88_004948 [Pleurodeles waltl]
MRYVSSYRKPIQERCFPKRHGDGSQREEEIDRGDAARSQHRPLHRPLLAALVLSRYRPFPHGRQLPH